MNAAAVRTPPQTVAPNAIADALRAIWRDCCAAEPKTDVSRALLVNFIVVGDAAREGELRQGLDGMAARLPCRAFLVTLADGGGPVRAIVSGAARLHGQARDLVLEQIELQGSRATAERLAGIVRPLLVNDLPSHLYWASDWPADVRPFELFAALSEHAIVDSARFSLPAVQLPALEQQRRGGRAITDLTWLRLRPWRRALAEALERCGPCGDAATTVTIRHGQAAVAAGMLLGRWLEERLGARVFLEASCAERSCPCAVELQRGGDAVSLTFVEPAQIQVRVTGRSASSVPFTVPASRGNEAGLLAAAIDLA